MKVGTNFRNSKIVGRQQRSRNETSLGEIEKIGEPSSARRVRGTKRAENGCGDKREVGRTKMRSGGLRNRKRRRCEKYGSCC